MSRLASDTTSSARALNQTLIRAGMGLSDVSWLVLDVETTGLLPQRGHRIVELGLVRGWDDPGQSFRFNPEHPMTARAQGLTQLSDACLSQAPGFGACEPDFGPLLRQTTLWIGHNISFDLAFLREEYGRLGHQLPPIWILDTLSLAKRLWPERGPWRLRDLALTLKLDPYAPHHAALLDAKLTRALLGALLSICPTHDLLELGARRIALAPSTRPHFF